MNFNRLKLMRKAARVQRMHTMTSIRAQSVGEHSFGVIALLLEIWEDHDSDAVPDVDEPRMFRLVAAAIYHDAAEAITGDTPSPAKWRHQPLEEALKEVERKVAEEFALELDLTEHEKRLLKYCDLMELAMYAMEELETGNLSMAVVVRNALAGLRKRGLTDVSPSALRLFDLVQTKYESKYVGTLGSDVTHGWSDFG